MMIASDAVDPQLSYISHRCIKSVDKAFCHKRVEALWIFMLDRWLTLLLRIGPWATSGEDSYNLSIVSSEERGRVRRTTLALLF
jgi:hypothetical protein